MTLVVDCEKNQWYEAEEYGRWGQGLSAGVGHYAWYASGQRSAVLSWWNPSLKFGVLVIISPLLCAIHT